MNGNMNGKLAQRLLSDKQYSERTQISLSPTLRRVIDIRCQLYGESLAGYLRKAAIMRILAEEEKKEARLLAMRNFVGGGDKKAHPEWSTPQKIDGWQRKIRRESEEGLDADLKLWEDLRKE